MNFKIWQREKPTVTGKLLHEGEAGAATNTLNVRESIGAFFLGILATGLLGMLMRSEGRNRKLIKEREKMLVGK